MKHALKAATIALSVFAVTSLPRAAQAETPNFNDDQVKSIQKIIKDYLLANPEVLLEVQEAYEKKNAAKQAEAQAARLPEFYKNLSAMKADLTPFTVGSGDVTVVEFFDYNCGYCQHMLPNVVKLLDSDKKVKVLFMEYPILSPHSQEASRVAVAAAKQGKYYEFHQAMLSAGRASKESALKIAEKVGLDMTKVKADMDSPETTALITKMSELGRKIMVDGTPSFLIGDVMSPGAIEYDQLQQTIDEVRKSGCKACEGGTSEKKS